MRMKLVLKEDIFIFLGPVFFFINVVMTNWRVILITGAYVIAGSAILALLVFLLGAKIVLWTIGGIAVIICCVIFLIGFLWGQ